MAGDPFGLLLRQRIVFLGGEVCGHVPGGSHGLAGSVKCWERRACAPQVNDFVADAVVSQLLMLDATDPTKVG